MFVWKRKNYDSNFDSFRKNIIDSEMVVWIITNITFDYIFCVKRKDHVFSLEWLLPWQISIRDKKNWVQKTLGIQNIHHMRKEVMTEMPDYRLHAFKKSCYPRDTWIESPLNMKIFLSWRILFSLLIHSFFMFLLINHFEKSSVVNHAWSILMLLKIYQLIFDVFHFLQKIRYICQQFSMQKNVMFTLWIY